MLQIDDVDFKPPRRRTSRRLLETLSERNQRSTQTSIREIPSEFDSNTDTRSSVKTLSSEFEPRSDVSSVVVADAFRSS